MEQSDATLALQHIFSDISGTSYAKGGTNETATYLPDALGGS
jgi:hypothetical protein